MVPGRGQGYDVAKLTPARKDELIALCARYLMNAKRGKEPLDPVARFHLANGASLERLNWMADPSTSGVQRSFGLMANYLYRVEDLDRHVVRLRVDGVDSVPFTEITDPPGFEFSANQKVTIP